MSESVDLTVSIEEIEDIQTRVDPNIDVGEASAATETVKVEGFEQVRLITVSREKARVGLAWAFVAIFAVSVLGAFIILLLDRQKWSDEKELLQLLLPAETALLGSAVGFYFGARSEGGSGR